MLVKYIDSDYIIERLQKPSWGEVEEPDFYITMASNRVKALIFPSEQGDPNNLESYTEEQQEAIKLATAIYAMWYFDTNYDFTNGSVSVNFGGVSMSESKTYNGEMVLPNVFDILKQANLIPTTETFIFSGENSLYADTAINPKAFKDLQQEVERQADVNIKQDAKIVDIYDTLANMGGFDISEVKEEIEKIQDEQVEQNKAIENNATEIETTKTDLGDLGDQVIDVQNKTNENTTNIEANTTQIQATSKLLNDTIEELKKQKWVSYKGTYQPGTTYNTGDLVVLNSVFYLSNADNNTTTPPGSQWDIIENPTGGGQIDLSNYYNKQEIDTQQTEQNVKIQANTDALNQKVDLTTAQTITGPKTFNKLVLPDKVFFGPENDPDYTYDRTTGEISQTNGLDLTLNDNALTSKEYVDYAINQALAPLKEYAKTGIIQIVIWSQNGYKIRLIPILTPPSLLGRENQFLDRIHISTTTTQYNTHNRYGYQEWVGGEYVEISNPQMNTDIEVRALNTNNFRDNNITMNLYTWWDMNQNLITATNGDWSPKIIIPITSRYDRNGITAYFVYKAVN